MSATRETKGLPTWVYAALFGAVFGIALDIAGIRLIDWRWWMLMVLCATLSTWSRNIGRRESTNAGSNANGCDTARERGGTI